MDFLNDFDTSSNSSSSSQQKKTKPKKKKNTLFSLFDDNEGTATPRQQQQKKNSSASSVPDKKTKPKKKKKTKRSKFDMAFADDDDNDAESSDDNEGKSAAAQSALQTAGKSDATRFDDGNLQPVATKVVASASHYDEENPEDSKERKAAKLRLRNNIEAQRAEKVAEMKIQMEREQKDREEMQDMRSDVEARLVSWEKNSKGQRKDIRALLSGLNGVLWSGSRWTHKALGDLLTYNQLKRAKKIAMIVVHPDKNSDASVERKATAERCFTVIHEAWEVYMATNPQ
jgi:hypothetical protein